jgi:hypothetical protein
MIFIAGISLQRFFHGPMLLSDKDKQIGEMSLKPGTF